MNHSERQENLAGILGVDQMESIGLQGMRQSWFVALKEEFKKPYFKRLVDFVHNDRMNQWSVSPSAHAVFNWTKFCDIQDVKGVIVGQDPYHNPDLATGLAFSIENGKTLTPSLQNIFKELSMDLGPRGFQPRGHGDGDLTDWAEQGVVMLNSVLSNHEDKYLQDIGWLQFTDAVVDQISRKSDHAVFFMLWGNVARDKRSFIDEVNVNFAT